MIISTKQANSLVGEAGSNLGTNPRVTAGLPAVWSSWNQAKRLGSGFNKWGRHPRLLGHSLIIVLITAIVVIGSLGARASQASLASIEAPDALVPQTDTTSLVDESATTFIAANVANYLELAVSETVTERALDLANAVQINDQSLAKQQLVATPGQFPRSIKTYEVQEGDTIASVAEAFGLEADTVIWANNLRSSSNLRVGSKLKILPVDGILHTVATGETVAAIADRYSADGEKIIRLNDLEAEGLKVGEQIIVPGGVRPVSGAFVFRFYPTYAGNGYDYGWCTWWAAERRAQIGRPIPSNWGNAYSWVYGAEASGYRVGSVPAVGAVISHRGGNHVGVVESVSAGSIVISEMNYEHWGYPQTYRTIPASEYGSYSFIY